MTALVVGAGPRMGRALAAALAGQHGPVGLIGRNDAALNQVCTDLAAAGVEAAGFAADLTDDAALVGAIAAARDRLGPARVVVFNASLFVPGTPSQIPLPKFRVGLATGLTAALVTLQATVADLRAAAPGSTLLFTGSGAAVSPTAASAGLGVQKAGLRHLALAAAQELGPDRVHVALVTIRGTLAEGGPFDPDRIAAVYADLATPGIDRPVEVTFTADGPDWIPSRR